MLEIFNEDYFFDMDAFDEYVQIKHEDIEPNSGDTQGNTISIVKYEVGKLMMEVIMDGHDAIDEKMGSKSTELSIPFKLAFNTLLNKKIITKY